MTVLFDRATAYKEIPAGTSAPHSLGFSYPGDLLSEGRQKQSGPLQRAIPPPLIKRNTIADFVSNRAFQAAMATLSSSTPATDQGLTPLHVVVGIINIVVIIVVVVVVVVIVTIISNLK